MLFRTGTAFQSYRKTIVGRKQIVMQWEAGRRTPSTFCFIALFSSLSPLIWALVCLIFLANFLLLCFCLVTLFSFSLCFFFCSFCCCLLSIDSLDCSWKVTIKQASVKIGSLAEINGWSSESDQETYHIYKHNSHNFCACLDIMFLYTCKQNRQR
jgi:hypothetical protein